MFHNIYTRVPKGRKTWGMLSIAALSAGGVLGLGANAASAEQISGYTIMVSASSWLNVAVSEGSTAIGAPIIQWYADSGAEQEWNVPAEESTGQIVNQNSGMCVTTDGVAGDQLFQEPCSPPGFGWYNNQQWYNDFQSFGPSIFENPQSGLVMDVYGYSFGAGAAIDAWYPNQQINQGFWNATGN
ncbi:MAG: RICIN domain-containing protein [Acidimicrobiaceae bacterium]|nr:RICIN domain-containing protein [Acidimicrobiaceae bacterium]